MPESLLDKYPHLKLLLQENRERNSVALKKSEEKPSEPSTSPSGLTVKHANINTDVSALSKLRERKSILGPGVGVRASTSSNSLPSSKSTDPSSRRKVNAEELFAESVAADNDQWISFQIEKIPASQQIEQLKMWLVTNKPSQVMRSSGVGWIAVKMTGRSGKNLEAKEEWDTWTGVRNMETVNTVARKHGVTGGKWLCHVSREHVDKCWHKLAIAMFSGGLGPSVYMIKVSPAVDDGGRNEHVICVYTPDYQDTSQVMRVENLIRSAGMAGDLLYKPDIFSTLGIYRSNKWGFRASIYTSKAMLLEGRSRITIAGSERCYYNSSKGFQCPEDLDIDKITAKINASITKPLPQVEAPPTKEQIAEEALTDLVGKFAETENVGKEEGRKSDKFGDDLARKLGMLGIQSLDEMTKKI